MPDPLPEPDRQAAFLALIELQDTGVNVADSRAQVAARFGIAVEDVRGIEREGLDNGWLPG